MRTIGEHKTLSLAEEIRQYEPIVDPERFLLALPPSAVHRCGHSECVIVDLPKWAVEFKRFLIAIDKAVPAELDVHLICDNLATHKTKAINEWFDKHPRFHMHFTPTGSSWINQVERWFGLLTDQLLRRGVHKSVAALKNDVRDWITAWNDDPKPFRWTETAEEILDSLARYIARVSGADTNEASLGPPRWAAGLGGIVAVGCWLRSGPSLPSDDSRRRREAGRWSGPDWPIRLVVMAAVVTVNDVLDGHVVLDVECLDRIYLNGYVPNLQVGGQVVSFLTAHLGYQIPSPAILEKIGTAFRKAVDRFAADNKIPVVRFGKNDRKIEVMRPYLARQAATGRSGVAAIGVAQEFAPVFTAIKKQRGKTVWFSFTKADRRVTCYYFYVFDDDFGPAFVKVCAYFPYPMKIWLNGHEWAKRQALKAGIGFTELSNGFAACTDPTALQAICDRLGPGRDAGVRRTLVVDPAAAADRARPCGRLLVGAVDAPNRDLAHPGVRRTPPCPRVLRGPGRRQPRHRPPGADRTGLQTRRTPRRQGGWPVQDQDRHLRHRGQRQRVLPALPHQAVFELRREVARDE